jgi:hypothetical protein
MSTPIDTTTNETDLVIEVAETPDQELADIILAAIAEELDVDPISLPPLGNSINPDLINEIVDDTYPAVRTLSFEYLGYEVTITHDGVISFQMRE